MTALVCPDQRELAAYDRGYLPAETIDELTHHLEQCPACLNRLDDLDGPPDPLLCLLCQRDSRVRDGSIPNPSELAALLNRATEIPYATLAHTLSHWDSAPLPVGELPASNVPTELGQYRLLRELGRGGMGTVYKALHLRLETLVALKVLSPERLHDPHAVTRFEREMKAIGKLKHPYIVAAHDAGVASGVHFLVMELIEGEDLSTLVRRRGPLPIADACELVRQAAEGLQVIHQHGLVHRDIKPSNLMLTSSGTIKILDLGLALLQDKLHSHLSEKSAGGEEVSPPTRVLGTADYLAPEQARDSRAIDIRADLYSLGCTLVKLLTGEPPYAAPRWKSVEQKVAAHISAALPDVRQRRPEIPPDLVIVIERLLAKNPADRYATPAAAAAALSPFSKNGNAAQRQLPSPRGGTGAGGEGAALLPRRQLLSLAAIVLLPLALVAYFFTGEATVTFHLHEPGIQIMIDGREAPSDIRFLPERVERHLRLPAGHHHLLVSKPGNRPYATSFWLVRHGDRLFEITLPREAPASSPPSTPNNGPPVETTNPVNAWEISVRTAAGQHSDVLYVPLKTDWTGARRTNLVEDAIFWGPFGSDQPDSIWIFRAHVQAEADQSVDIFFGHDDGAALYLNNELVSRSGSTAGHYGHLAFSGKLDFRRGLNTLEMAVYVAQGVSSINLGAIAPRHAHSLSQVPGLTLRAPP